MATKKNCAIYRQKLKQRAKDAIGKCCIFCGDMYDIQMAHIHPTNISGPSRGMGRRFIDVIRNPHSYRPMCSEHHKQYDAGKLRLSDALYGYCT